MPKHAHGNTGETTISEKDFTLKYYAAVTFFQLQDRWADKLNWTEEKMRA